MSRRWLSSLSRSVSRPKIVLAVGDETLPLSEQFSLGGQTSFFGYPEDNAWGRQLFVASLEYQYELPLKLFFDTYVKARYDLGSTWLKPEEIRLEDMEHGLGVSIALDTPVGPAEFSLGRSFYLRKDLLTHPLTWGPMMFYFSIGTPLVSVGDRR
jgi:NTE family protein